MSEGLADEELIQADEELVAGRRPVEEAFAARRDAHRLLVVPQRRQALERIVLHATNLRIPIVEVEGGTLTALAGFDGHQGVALAVAPRVYSSIEAVIARARERDEPPFVLALDSLEDPQNVGTLLRSAEAAGVHGVLFPTHRQAPLTPAAVKASAGAVEHLLLVPVDDLAAALTDLHIKGLRVAGAEAEAPLELRDADLRGPLALVVGSEGQGLGAAIRRRCDLMLRIPMRGHIGSLNAAVAGSIVLFEALGQRGGAAAGTVRETRAPEQSAEADASVESDAIGHEPATSDAPARADPEVAVPSAALPRRRRSTMAAPDSGAPAAGAPGADQGRAPRRRARASARDAAAASSSAEATEAAPDTGEPADPAAPVENPAATRPRARPRARKAEAAVDADVDDSVAGADHAGADESGSGAAGPDSAVAGESGRVDAADGSPDLESTDSLLLPE